MQSADTPSWRFEVSFTQLPHLVLFVRDALRLEVGIGRSVPARLVPGVPDLSYRLDEITRQQAGLEWTPWWEAAVELIADASAAARSGGNAIEEYARRIVGILDPPDWRSLRNLPALRQAVRATFEDGLRFANEVRRPLLSGEQPFLFPHPSVRRAAETVAHAAGVPLGALDAHAEVIDVRGPWWVLVQRGELLCSAEAARADDLADEALTAVFRSLV